MMERIVLTEKQKQALTSVVGGADVMSLVYAIELRRISHLYPELVVIGSAMCEYEKASQLPYFGAICTKAGEEFLGIENLIKR